MKTSELRDFAARVRRWNDWRRDDGEFKQSGAPEDYRPIPSPENPKELGELLEAAAGAMEELAETRSRKVRGPLGRPKRVGLDAKDLKRWREALEHWEDYPWGVTGWMGQTVVAMPVEFPGHYFGVAKCEHKEMARYIVGLHNAALKAKKEGSNDAEA